MTPARLAYLTAPENRPILNLVFAPGTDRTIDVLPDGSWRMLVSIDEGSLRNIVADGAKMIGAAQ